MKGLVPLCDTKLLHLLFRLSSKMNLTNTFWDTTEEAIGHFFLGGLTLIVFGYAIFVSYAIYDYQGIIHILCLKIVVIIF